MSGTVLCRPVDLLEFRALLSPPERAPDDDVEESLVDRTAAQLLPMDPLPKWVLRDVEHFRERAHAAGHQPHRVQQAVRRFLLPFCAHGRSGAIELGWQELTRQQRRDVVRFGLEIERIWLGPAPTSTPLTPAPRKTAHPAKPDDELGDVASAIEAIDWAEAESDYRAGRLDPPSNASASRGSAANRR